MNRQELKQYIAAVAYLMRRGFVHYRAGELRVSDAGRNWLSS